MTIQFIFSTTIFGFI